MQSTQKIGDSYLKWILLASLAVLVGILIWASAATSTVLMQIHEIGLSINSMPGGLHEAEANILVMDANGVPLEEVIVTGQWQLNGYTIIASISSETDAAGYATTHTIGGSVSAPGDTFSFSVTNLHKDGYYWDGAAVTQGSKTIR